MFGVNKFKIGSTKFKYHKKQDARDFLSLLDSKVDTLLYTGDTPETSKQKILILFGTTTEDKELAFFTLHNISGAFELQTIRGYRLHQLNKFTPFKIMNLKDTARSQISHLLQDEVTEKGFERVFRGLVGAYLEYPTLL